MTKAELAKVREGVIKAINEEIMQGDQYGAWWAKSPDTDPIIYNVKRFLYSLKDDEGNVD